MNLAEWRENLERNWLYMVTATVIAIFLWVAVNADRVDEKIVAVDLVVINEDRRFVLVGREPQSETVDVRFTGRAGDMEGLDLSRPQLFVPVDSVESQLMEVVLEPEMVKGRGGGDLSDVRAVSVVPAQLTLHFEPRGQKSVPVVARTRIDVANGFMLADSIRVQPSSVVVEGAESAVSGIDSIYTVPIVRNELRESIDVEVPLDRPDAPSPIDLSSPSVRIDVEVQPRAERVFRGVPLAVRGIDPAAVRLDPTLVDIRLIGPRNVVDAVRPESLRPRVSLMGTESVGDRIAVSMPAPDAFVQVRLDPDSVRVADRIADGS